jgi:hypothetical protein
VFDARLILAGQQADPIGAARSFADLLQANQAMDMRGAQEQRTLADLTKQQQHESGLLDLLRSAGPAPQQRLAALQSDPRFFTESMGLESHIANVGAKSRGAEAGFQKAMNETREQMVSLLSTTTDEADYQRRLATLPEQSRAMFPKTWAETKPIVDALAGSPDVQAKLARADLDRARAGKFRQGPAPANPDKQEADALKREGQRLKNEATRKKLDAAGEPDPLLAVEGYVPRKGFKVKPEVAEKLRGAQADTATMEEGLDELMALYRQHRNQVLPGAARARMSSLATHLQLTAKGPTMFGLGVIAGPDMDLLNAVITNPTKKDATFADFFGGGGKELSETMERLRVMREQVGKKLHNTIVKRGYDAEKKGGPGAPAVGKVRVSNGKETLEVDAADLPDAEADGFKRLDL